MLRILTRFRVLRRPKWWIKYCYVIFRFFILFILVTPILLFFGWREKKMQNNVFFATPWDLLTTKRLLTRWWVTNFRAFLFDFSSFRPKKMKIDITSLKRRKNWKRPQKSILSKCLVRPAPKSWSKILNPRWPSYCPFILITNSGHFFKKNTFT